MVIPINLKPSNHLTIEMALTSALQGVAPFRPSADGSHQLACPRHRYPITPAPCIAMDFIPREALFFCDNFLTLELIGFNFRLEPFQLKRQILSIWFNEKSEWGVHVVGP